MTFTVDRAELSAALRFVSTVAAKRDTIPILSAILFEPVDGGLLLTASNMEQQATAGVAFEGEIAASFGVDREKLRLAIDNIANGPLTMTITERSLSIKAKNGGSRKLQTVAADQFPKIELPAMPARLTMEGDELSDGFEQTRDAASDATAGYLQGVHVAVAESGRVHFVATDSKRIHLREVDATEAQDWNPVTVPTAAIAAILAVVGDGSEVRLSSDGSRLLRADSGRRSVVTKLLEGRYPPYERVLTAARQANARSLFGSAEEIARAFMAAGALADDMHRQVRIIVKDEGVTATVTRDAEAQEPVEVEADGGEFEVAFNSRFARDGLKLFGERPVTWRIGAAGQPTIIEAKDYGLAVAIGSLA